MTKPRLAVAITGASGAIYGIRMLEYLKSMDVESHLIMSKAAGITINAETDYSVKQVQDLADVVHPASDIGATLASGSFKTLGMIIAPCSIKTLCDVAYGSTDNLISRGADVVLKERRRLVMMVRETPFHLGHLRAMTAVTEMGAIVMPPLPAFYTNPESLDDIVNHSVGRALDLFDLDCGDVKRWEGLGQNPDK